MHGNGAACSSQWGNFKQMRIGDNTFAIIADSCNRNMFSFID